MTSNLRQYDRFTSRHIITVKDAKNREVQADKALVNISEGGLLFYAKRQMESGDSINVSIEIPEFNSSIAVGAKVSWSQAAMERTGAYFVGIQFADIKDTDKGLISKLREQSSN